MIDVSRRTLLGSLGAGLLMTASRAATAAPRPSRRWKKAGEVKIGCEAAYVPFTYRDNTGKIVGFDVDSATKMLGAARREADASSTRVWSGIIPALQAGRFDMVPTMSYTKERLERVLFSIPYADASQALLIRVRPTRTRSRSIADLSGKVLGNKIGSAGETLYETVRSPAQEPSAARASRMHKLYDDHPAAYLALAQGSVDGVLNTVPTLSVVLRDKPGTFTMIQGVAGNELSRLRLPQGGHRDSPTSSTAASPP